MSCIVISPLSPPTRPASSSQHGARCLVSERHCCESDCCKSRLESVVEVEEERIFSSLLRSTQARTTIREELSCRRPSKCAHHT